MSQPKHLDPASMGEFYGAELRRRREDAGMSQSGLGELVYCSGAYIGLMEMASRRPQLDLSERIDAALNTDGFFRRLCEAILKASKFAGYFAAAAELEQRALAISDFATMVVPGLLQTAAYTRSLIESARPLVDPQEIERRVSVRQERARALLKDPADPELWFIVHEAVLRVPVGGDGVMREQLEHFAEVIRNRQAVIQVMPFSGGVNPLLYGTTTLMTFADEPPVAYTESAYSGQLIEDPTVVAGNAKSYDLARAAAMSPEASLAFIGRLTEDYTP
ncbi:helix-turn-helix domain-containing protein [Streptomyces sp. HUCO-GS316]|uniref:helix-turn-helix domain-containing protein n=1 Tax=Streptomyces sp. HUCO-GS316 TaxID=2692198 RepID=UPI00137033D0|nr:helix-turn-helix transcriptional regulator [Streptomyces sp. HUCO-GS316]MXM68807.1 helix-turn-helix domain-containing protein [Streptomyces sp. HUCO-GS316]